jgi:RNA polymerase sigma-70 factor (ECF subfamily)
MESPSSTCWTVIREAASGSREHREEFARRYAPVVRAYLAGRWRSSPQRLEIEDAVQEVFLDCFRDGGALARADPSWPGGFRAFVYGVVRNVALMAERRHARRKDRPAPEALEFDEVQSPEESLSRLFDQAWAKAIVREAAVRHAARAGNAGEEARRRVDLLKLRFHDGLPIREIARLWEVDPASLHREYARAREEFREALGEVVAFHHPGAGPDEIERECEALAALLETP